MTKVGDEYTVEVWDKYGRLYQERPFDCRPKCQCGECNGVSHTEVGVVEDICYFMDNSTEAYVRTPDGVRHKVTLEYPHGDACF